MDRCDVNQSDSDRLARGKDQAFEGIGLNLFEIEKDVFLDGRQEGKRWEVGVIALIAVVAIADDDVRFAVGIAELSRWVVGSDERPMCQERKQEDKEPCQHCRQI